MNDLANIFHGNICDVSLGTITLEVQGKEDKMRALQEVLRPYGECTVTCAKFLMSRQRLCCPALHCCCSLLGYKDGLPIAVTAGCRYT